MKNMTDITAYMQKMDTELLTMGRTTTCIMSVFLLALCVYLNRVMKLESKGFHFMMFVLLLMIIAFTMTFPWLL
jgi:hypothetical protein